MRKLVTISLSPRLFSEALRVAEVESRTKSELFREALRFYLDSFKIRKQGRREQIFALIDKVQEKTSNISPLNIRKLVREAVKSARKVS